MSWERELDEIEDQLTHAVPAAARVALLERAVQLCDAHDAIDVAWSYREELLSAVYYTGDWDKLLVHFAWCLGRHDREPARFPLNDLLWKYKWVVTEAACMPQIGRARLLALLADMERRFLAAGSTQRAVHEHAAIVHTSLGDADVARAALTRWEQTERDWLSDCVACEHATRASLLDELGDADASLEVLRGILARRLTCAEEPHRTYAKLVAPLWRRGERAHAIEAFRQGYPLVRGGDKHVDSHAAYLRFVAAAGLDDEAVAMFERHVAAAVACPSAWPRMLFFEATRFAMSTLAARGHRVVAARLPEGVDVPDRDRATVEALASWAGAQAEKHVAAFERRNGNDHMRRFVRRWVDLPIA
ncbi:hypothetical protein [Sandaracinus amylolyticus]|uniref:hypothetical protein n=1 Tax=Sandaracinus amylolyticus TaxID=927083 RepID=UPI001F3A8210|nr:hypothetical protein [Sandaracinus amylolyticus]UJR87200.1 Hypothetical protein I5071_93010 [Sandaracinus amylolyticus]